MKVMMIKFAAAALALTLLPACADTRVGCAVTEAELKAEGEKLASELAGATGCRYWLSTDGDDDNDGTLPTRAKRTIEGCYAAGWPDGATVGVLPGDYTPPSNDCDGVIAGEYYFIPATNRLSFVALCGPGRTRIVGVKEGPDAWGNGWHHTLAFYTEGQAFTGFTLTNLASCRLFDYSTNTGSGPMACGVAFTNCVFEGCGGEYALRWSAVNTCEFSGCRFAGTRFIALKGGNTSPAFNGCRIDNTRFEGVVFGAKQTSEYPKNGAFRFLADTTMANSWLSFSTNSLDISFNTSSSMMTNCVISGPAVKIANKAVDCAYLVTYQSYKDATNALNAAGVLSERLTSLEARVSSLEHPVEASSGEE